MNATVGTVGNPNFFFVGRERNSVARAPVTGQALPRPAVTLHLNIPYDRAFEDLYVAYIVGLTQLGLHVRAALAVPNQGRLATIIELIEQSEFSIHDLSRVEVSRGVPRFNMPVELPAGAWDIVVDIPLVQGTDHTAGPERQFGSLPALSPGISGVLLNET
jgi:hypothetical protein